MKLQEYLDQGGTREEKLTVVYHNAPGALSPDYRAIFTLLDSNNSNVSEPTAQAFPDLAAAFNSYEEVEIEGEDSTE